MSWPGEQLFIRIIDLFDKGVSAGLRPRQLKLEARARAEARRFELLDAAQAMNDAEDIRARRKALTPEGKFLALPSPTTPTGFSEEDDDVPGWAEIVRNDGVADRLRKLSNLKKIAVYAEEEAERITDEGMKQDAQVEPDWFAHWRRLAEQVSNEEAQRLWARVLAGEAKEPGSYGHRTLEFLAMMTRKDAELIEAVASFRVNGNALFREFTEIYAAGGVNLAGLLHLESIGVLVNTGSLLGVTHEMQPVDLRGQKYVYVENNGAALLLCSDEMKKLQFASALFTEVGTELMKFVEATPSYPLLSGIAKKALREGFTRARIGKVYANSVGELHDFDPDQV